MLQQLEQLPGFAAKQPLLSASQLPLESRQGSDYNFCTDLDAWSISSCNHYYEFFDGGYYQCEQNPNADDNVWKNLKQEYPCVRGIERFK